MATPDHRKRVEHYHRPGDFHEFTFSCHGRRPLLNKATWLRQLAVDLNTACQNQSIDLVAFVFMPEHVHLLVYPRNPDPNFGLFLAQIKQPFSKKIKAILADDSPELFQHLTVQERPGKKCFRFWQPGAGFDRNLFRPEAIAAAIDYIHCNPVKRGLCQRAIDWKWSSARYYHLEPPRQQFDELPTVEGPPAGSFDGFVDR